MTTSNEPINLSGINPQQETALSAGIEYLARGLKASQRVVQNETAAMRPSVNMPPKLSRWYHVYAQI